MSRHGGAPHRGESSNDPAILAAVPTLRVMRLQSPELHQPRSGTLGGQCLLHTSLCLPDSLAVYVGEKFTAYLGILNASKSVAIRRLTVTAQLQTPSQRWQLPSHLDPSSVGNSSSSSSSVSSAAGLDVEPESAVDAIVSHDIEESGPHILRVEVAYLLPEGGSKTFRKFYRFNVVSPLTIREHTLRWGEQACFVSLSVEFRPDPGHTDSLVISQADFVCADGLSAQKIGTGSALSRDEAKKDETNSGAVEACAVDLLDSSGLLSPDMCFRYLFKVTATTDDAVLRGIAAGDLLGKACFTWRKAMGETGRVYSEPIYCPPAHPETSESSSSNFVMYNSGLSVDVAADSATRGSRGALPVDSPDILSNQFPVTVEPIDPPTKMTTYQPVQVEFLVVNHSSQAMTLQLQFRLSEMADHIAVCGQSFKGVGEVPPNGGSRVVAMRFLPLNAGLLKVQGCHVVDMATGREIPQPPLFTTFVEEQPETGNAPSPAIVLARQ